MYDKIKNMKLTAYKKKRNFKKTPEPKAKKSRSTNKNLYVIQKHDASHLHYDFRLELNGVLVSWAVPKGPCLDPSVKRLAVHVEDHPIEYGSFEGTIPKGQYGAGTVLLWDNGTWESLDKNPDDAYRKGNMSFELYGKKLHGKWKLIRINKNDKTWLLIKLKDEYAKLIKKYDIEKLEPNSVLHESGSEKFISSVSPELATLVDEPPTGNNWLHEIKFDGYRIIAMKKNGKTKLYSRNQLDWTKKFSKVADEINQLPIPSFIVDGEMVVLDKNQKSNFQLLQNAIKSKNAEMIYFVFDILYYHDKQTTSLPLLDRKNLLSTLVPKKHSTIKFSDHIIGSGKKVFQNACKMGLEGIVSKEINSPYIQHRTRDWLKAKCNKRQEFVIVGFTAPKNKRSHFGSLLLATYNKKNELIYNGNVGTGFTEASLKSIKEQLSKYVTPHSPLKKAPKDTRKITWVKPVLAAEVEFIEWTSDGLLRHPSFKGLRADKSPQMITHEKPMPIKKVSLDKFTHLDKIFYPEDNITKEELIQYYEVVEDKIFPYIKDRLLTLFRCPENFRHCFFQRHQDEKIKQSPFKTIMLQEKKKKSLYIYIDDKNSVVMLPQYNVLEIHPWGSQIDAIDYPDVIIFDLDPAEDVAWKTLVQAAKLIQKELNKIKLKCFLKTTGGKGLHIVIPIEPEYQWEEVKHFTHTFVQYLTLNHPDLFVGKMQKSLRKGHIFVDYLRNQFSATAIAPYSTRARIHAPVATPIHWDELTNNPKDTFFTIKTIPKRLDRLRSDPWKDYFKIKQSINIK